MSTDQPYNSLGQILSEGGEIALGLAIAHGWSEGKISALFARRFEPMSANDRNRLLEIASAAVSAADLVNNLGPNDSLVPGDLPITPELFGNDPEGRRALLITEFSTDDGGKWYETRLTFADIPTMEEIREAIAAEASRRIVDSPSAFGLNRGDPQPELLFRVTFGEARF